MCVVELLDVFERAFIVLRDEIDRHTLTTESSASTDPINIVKKNNFKNVAHTQTPYPIKLQFRY